MTTPPETPPRLQRKRRASPSLTVRVRQAQAGDRHAQDLLVHSFQDMAIGYAASLLGDIHRAEDVAQEAFVEAFRRLSSLQIPEAFPSLLQALIRKHCDRLTRRRSLDLVRLEETFRTTVGAEDPMYQMQVAARREMVHQAVRELSRPEREVVLLFYMGERSHQQVADELCLPVSTVKSRLHEARKHLRQKMWMFEEEITLEKRSARPKRVLEEVVKQPYLPDPAGKIVVKKKYLSTERINDAGEL